MPSKDKHAPDTLSTADKITFDQWYDVQVAGSATFNMQRNFLAYCISDMHLFQRTQLCPFR